MDNRYFQKGMNFRDRLKRKAVKTKDPFIWNQLNQVNWEINSAKKASYENAFCYDIIQSSNTKFKLQAGICIMTIRNVGH